MLRLPLRLLDGTYTFISLYVVTAHFVTVTLLPRISADPHTTVVVGLPFVANYFHTDFCHFVNIYPLTCPTRSRLLRCYVLRYGHSWTPATLRSLLHYLHSPPFTRYYLPRYTTVPLPTPHLLHTYVIHSRRYLRCTDFTYSYVLVDPFHTWTPTCCVTFVLHRLYICCYSLYVTHATTFGYGADSLAPVRYFHVATRMDYVAVCLIYVDYRFTRLYVRLFVGVPDPRLPRTRWIRVTRLRSYSRLPHVPYVYSDYYVTPHVHHSFCYYLSRYYVVAVTFVDVTLPALQTVTRTEFRRRPFTGAPDGTSPLHV